MLRPVVDAAAGRRNGCDALDDPPCIAVSTNKTAHAQAQSRCPECGVRTLIMRPDTARISPEGPTVNAAIVSGSRVR
jgi:hypothetical protein